jgi:hypothetical protein
VSPQNLEYLRDEDDKIIKINNHYMDAPKLIIFSLAQQRKIIRKTSPVK